MFRQKKLPVYIATAVILALCVAGSVLFALFQNTAEPENPLNNIKTSKLFPPSDVGDLSVNEAALKYAGSAINGAENAANATEASKAAEDVTENTSQQPTAVTEKTTDISQGGNSSNGEAYIIPNAVNYFENVNGEGQGGNISSVGNNAAAKEENHTDNSGSVLATVPTEKATNKRSNKEHSPSDNTVDVEYFTTTIKDGETVKNRNYSFEITHKNKKLNVKELTVFVNDSTVSQFSGKVLLNEGRNSIRVQVTYTDTDGKAITVFKDYTVNVDLGDIVINTNLSDCTVDSEDISFSADAALGGEEIPLNVQCNGTALQNSGGEYTADLKQGENIIRLFAQYGSHKKELSFTVISTATKEFDIYTTVENTTVHNSSYSFTARCKNGSGNERLSVKLNGRVLAGNNNSYTAELKTGSNTIRLRAVDNVNGNEFTVEKSFAVRYVPQATPQTAPKLTYTNVSNGMNVKGNQLTLDVKAEDYKGNAIYYDGISVSLNGVEYNYKWTSEYVSYLLYLSNGSNTLDIRLTDKEGRYADYSFNINCTTVADGEKIGTITISVDANVLGLNYLLSPQKADIYQGETTARAVLRALESAGFVCHYTGTAEQGFYLSRIEKQGIGENAAVPEELVDYINSDGLTWTGARDNNSIGENDYTQGSGWMYTINGSFQGGGLSDVPIKDGDTLCLRYTLAYGKDIGGYVSRGGEEDNYPKIW